jgi:hypothetical protein
MSTPTHRPWPAPARLAALLAPLCLLSVACPDGSSHSPPPPQEDASAVTGQRIIHRRMETGDEPTRDGTGVLSTLTVLVPTEDTFETRAVTPTGEDTFKFTNIPEGPYYLKRGSSDYVITEHRELDLDEYVLGRAGVTTVTARPTVTLSVDGLAPMDAYQDFDFVAPNAGAAGLLSLEPPPVEGATGLVDQGAEYRSAFGRQEIIDGTKGDRLFLLQKLRRSAGGLSYFAIARALVRSDVTLRSDGQATRVSGTFSVVPPRQLTLDWRRASFEAHRAAVHPLAVPLAATSVRQSLFLAPAVGGLSEGVVGYAGELLSGNVAADDEDLSTTLEYGNPYPNTWGVVANVVHRYQIPVRLSESGPSGTVGASLKEQAELGVFASRPVEARLSPPTSLQVDGANAQEERGLSSLMPVFTWEPPTLGTADAYELRVFRLFILPSDPTFLRTEEVATFLTAQRRARLPPGVLTAGQAYVVRIAALRTPGVDLTRAPYRRHMLVDHSLAEALTSVLRAP